jgi:hypothetical protein
MIGQRKPNLRISSSSEPFNSMKVTDFIAELLIASEERLRPIMLM